MAVTDSTLVNHHSVWQPIPVIMHDNPALYGRAFGSSYSEVSINADYKHQTEAFIQEEGTGYFLPFANVKTFLVLNDHSSVWGSAGYMNGRHKDITWNSTSDYTLLEPYIMADTLGGDTRHERYSFSGGYQTLLGKLSLGTEVLFRAEQEYRDVDPRMRGIVTELNLRIGASVPYWQYIWGVAFTGQVYKQTNDVDFYDENGVIPEYQMTGLGTEYKRFSGDKRDLYYKGGGTTITLSALPQSGTGVYGNIELTQSRYRRVMANLNSMPLTDLRYETADIVAGWRHDGRNHFDFSARFAFTKRSGDEHIGGKSASTYFPTIGKLTMYKNYRLNASASALYGRRTTNNDWHITLTGGYRNNRERYMWVERRMSAAHAYGEIKVQWLHNISKSLMLQLGANFEYDGKASSDITMPYANMTAATIAMINHKYRYAEASYTQANALARIDYQLKASPIGLFASVKGGFVSCSTHETETNLRASVGLTF